MPKTRISERDILEAALRLVRREGYQAVNARSVAKEAACSVQPIYSGFDGMEGLMEALYAYGLRYLDGFVERHADRSNYFESVGQCHIRFAREEAGLFRFLFLSPYGKADTVEELYRRFAREDVTGQICETLGLTRSQAEKLYLNMMLYTHGIASFIAVGAAEFSREEIHETCSFACRAFLEKIKTGKCEEEKNEADHS